MKKYLSGLSKDKLIEMIHDQSQQLDDQATKIDDQAIQIRILERYIFARKNEKWTTEDKSQGKLFNEAETNMPSEQPESASVSAKSKTKKRKKKTGKKPLPKDLPREDVVYDVEDDEKLCPCCRKERPFIGEDITEQLEFIPAKIMIKKIHIKRYGACTCADFQKNGDFDQIVTARAPERFMPGSIASPSLVAHIITNKFCDALPFYRQERIFRRINIEISRQNMCNWAIKASRKCYGIVDQMKKSILNGPLINMDETRVQVLNEINRNAENNSFMWVMTGGDKTRRIVLFNYSPTRNQEVPMKLLEGYTGVLQTDGYAAYNKAVREYGLSHVGCLTHVRRKFYKLAKATKKKGKAHTGLEFSNRIYHVEHLLREENLPDNDFLEKRRRLAKPIWDDFYEWLKLMMSKGVSGPLGDAVKYAFNQYPNLIRYLDHPMVTPDNNAAESAIRPFVIGRKNWLFNNTSQGAHSSDILYSLVETAKANDVEPAEYLKFLFSALPEAGSNADWDTLMPWNMVK